MANENIARNCNVVKSSVDNASWGIRTENVMERLPSFDSCWYNRRKNTSVRWLHFLPHSTCVVFPDNSLTAQTS